MKYPGQIFFCLRASATLCAASIVFCSCDSGAQAILQRRETAIKNLNEYYVQRDAGPRWSRIASKSLVALTNSTAKSLQQPLLTSAILVQQTNRLVRLWVYWIASEPAADAVQLDLGDGTSPLTLPIATSDAKENESQAKLTVFFSAGFSWKDGNDLAERLNAVTTPLHLKVRLRRGNSPLTEWLPVDLNKAGNWVMPQ